MLRIFFSVLLMSSLFATVAKADVLKGQIKQISMYAENSAERFPRPKNVLPNQDVAMVKIALSGHGPGYAVVLMPARALFDATGRPLLQNGQILALQTRGLLEIKEVMLIKDLANRANLFPDFGERAYFFLSTGPLNQ